MAATKKTTAAKKTPLQKTATPQVEFYWCLDDDDLYTAIDSDPCKSMTGVLKEVQEYLDEGNSAREIYIFEVKRLPAKKIKTTVQITD